ncbi:cAMP-binding domain of CRP or a regulatory subunit of cAMP-dependent protein kinases [Flavobacterium sp. CF108]|uniref:Crp/Fnr family transcriptional regulator n=1 Tax=unclassified Flavobacterium TaxID=196869 RepID=UPI0008AE90F6|nr:MULTISPECIES: Crp/Fnr family transcriptional regulator [unclassified Flavobacterium]SEO25879.1 cAMP-binding domain of CRP or a regulatory subunit of cAMP-dependent protein kinases [Flavobacterium sp. fv08]SHG47136.1 cAMP-binding domain of CRP or a regulatory subunit of cAMP-dependent protein kinases [Flavobacterium sp. CF108]
MFDQFRDKFPLTDEKWIEYISYFNRIEVPAKTVLIEEGEVSKKLFIIEKGCIRVWFNNNGKDLTSQFFFENQSVASIESFIKKFPSPVVVETIEPSVLWWISKNDVDTILEEIKEIPELRDRLINMLFQRTFDYMKHFFSFIKDSPTQRYLSLIEEKPQIVQRVPQHYIASYLGVSTVHLSRIKSKLVHKK